MIVSAVFAVLAILALIVAFAPGTLLLSGDAIAPPAPIADRVASADPRAPSLDQGEAERLLAEALRRLTRLDSENVRRWGLEVVQGSSFGAAAEVLDRATALHDGGRYGEALPLFREAIAEFDRLGESKPERLRLAMAQGQTALDALDAPMALRQFEIAAALAPADPQATSGLDRARKLPDILSKIAQATAAETAGDLTQARASYQAAAALDPAFEPAARELRRVETLVATQTYRNALSETHARLNGGDLPGAQAALERARQINPQAPELRDVQQRLQGASRRAALEGLRIQAARLEHEEKWPDVVKVYDQALALDQQAAFASQGRTRARRLVEFHQAIDAYLAEPARLQSADPRAHARTLVAQINSSGESGSQLAVKTTRLAQLISTAQTPVPVLLRSDRSTAVVVQRVGALGTFDTRQIDLPPGRYLAVGSRPGYRDVRVPFEVSSGRVEPVVVQCTEPIR